MPAAGRKRVEGGPPDSVAIGRNRSQSVAIGRAETEDKAPKKVAFRRTGRDWSRLVAPKQKTRRRKKSRFGVSVAPKQKTRRRKSRNRSRLVAIGRAETEDKAPKKVAFRRTGRDWSRLVAIGRDWSRRNRRQGAEKSRVSAYRSRLVAIGRDWSQSVAPKQKTRRKHKKSPIPQSGIGLHNVARRRALLAFNELLAQIHMQALEAFC